MSNTARKSWSTEEKATIVLSVLRGELSMSEAARRHGVSYKTLLAWRDRFLRGGETTLRGRGLDAQVKSLASENKQLRKALAAMALQVGLLKRDRHS